MAQTDFDRAMALLEVPDVLSTKPSTIRATNALLGHTGTHIVQTAYQPGPDNDGFTCFLQVIDADSGQIVQVVLPDAVCRTLYRQRQALVDRSRRKPKPKLTPEQRRKQKLADARRLIREERKAAK